MPAASRILILGGGVGGLAAAAAIAQRGMEVELREKQLEFPIQGVGIGLPPNALRALKAIGILDECLSAGHQSDRIKYRDRYGTMIVDHRFLLGWRDDLPPFHAMSRRKLHSLLAEAATRAGADVRMGSTATSVGQDGRTVTVRFDDGHADTFDLVIGFDGLKSWTRRALYGLDHEPACTGFSVWRATAALPAEVTSQEVYLGVGSRAGVMPFSDKEMYLFHMRPEPAGARFDPESFPSMLRERLAGYGGVVAQVRDGLGASSTIVYSQLQPVLVPGPWYHGRVLVAGDAAHAFPPHLAQGAGMALEDAIVLAQELADRAPLEEALRSFMDRRAQRCAFVHDACLKMLHQEMSVANEDEAVVAAQRLRTVGAATLDAGDLYLDQEALEPSASHLGSTELRNVAP